ncbi:MAG: DUF805 domain-containing protein [Thermomonas sp.]
MEWYLKVLKNYVGFSGRARRKEYWMFTLFNIIAAVIAMILDNVLGLNFQGMGYGPIYALYGLAVLLPGLAVSIRRLHDTDRSGWWLLLGLIPLIGAIILIVWLATDGTAGDNRFGSNPKASPA